MNKDKKISLTIQIYQSDYDKLQLHIEKFRHHPEGLAMVAPFDKVTTVEELIEAYITQLSTMNETYAETNEKLEKIVQKFEEKGIDLNEIFNSFLTPQEKAQKKAFEEKKAARAASKRN